MLKISMMQKHVGADLWGKWTDAHVFSLDGVLEFEYFADMTYDIIKFADR